MTSGYKTLGQVAWTPSLGVEALRKTVVRLKPSKKREWKSEVWNRGLMTSDFLCPVTEIFVFALSLVSWIPQIISESLPFPWSQLEVGSSQLWFRLALDPSRSFDTSQTQTEAPVYFSTITSETLYFLLRIGCEDHQIQFTSILGRSAPSVSECVLGAALLIPEPL